jgi:hypothetical protein
MEPWGVLPWCQESATGSYPDPDESSLHIYILLIVIHVLFNINLPPTPRSPSGLFPSGFSTKIMYAFLIPQFALPISFSLFYDPNTI